VVPVLNVMLDKVVAFAKEGSLAEWGKRAGIAIAELIPKIIEFVRVAGTAFVRVIPQALLFMIDIIGKVGLAFSGWALIWNGLKQGWLALEIVVLEGAKKVEQALMAIMQSHNIGGVFDQSIALYKKGIADLDKTIGSLDVGLAGAVTEQDDLLNATDSHQRKIKEYEQSIKGMEGAFDSFADSMSSAMKGAADESIAQLDRVQRKADSVKWSGVGVGKNGADSIDGFSRTVDEQERQGG
jgi:hypothetical protein